MTTSKDGQVVLSKGTQAVAGALFAAICTIGGWGLTEMRGLRRDSAAEMQRFRNDINEQFDDVNGKVSQLITTQAVLSERLDNTRELQTEVGALRTEVTDLRLELVEMKKNPDQ